MLIDKKKQNKDIMPIEIKSKFDKDQIVYGVVNGYPMKLKVTGISSIHSWGESYQLDIMTETIPTKHYNYIATYPLSEDLLFKSKGEMFSWFKEMVDRL